MVIGNNSIWPVFSLLPGCNWMGQVSVHSIGISSHVQNTEFNLYVKL